MSWANIRTKLKTLIEAVSGIGIVHDYQRWSVESGDDATLFVSSGRYNVCYITRDESLEDFEASDQHYRRHQVRLIMFYSVDDSDATEKTFSDLMEAICDDLRADATLTTSAESSAPPQVVNDGHTRFRGALCHYGEITVEIREDATF